MYKQVDLLHVIALKIRNILVLVDNLYQEYWASNSVEYQRMLACLNFGSN